MTWFKVTWYLIKRVKVKVFNTKFCFFSTSLLHVQLKNLTFSLDGTGSHKDLLLYGHNKTKNCTESYPRLFIGLKFHSLLILCFHDDMYLGFGFLSGDDKCSFQLHVLDDTSLWILLYILLYLKIFLQRHSLLTPHL